MILVDTSVFVNFFRDRDTPGARALDRLIEFDVPFGLCGMIYQELLQGAADEREFRRLKTYLSTQRFLAPDPGIETHETAARLFFRCRRAGVTVRSGADALIAALAVERDLELLHDDADFDRMAGVIKELKIHSTR